MIDVAENTHGAEGGQKSVIDYMLVNAKLYQCFQNMDIDENQEAIDTTDHNLLCAGFPLSDRVLNFNRHGKWEKKEYYKTDASSLN